jgi:hypothetical protein
MPLSSNCSSLESLIIMNVGVDGVVCLQRFFKVFSSGLNVSKIIGGHNF